MKVWMLAWVSGLLWSAFGLLAVQLIFIVVTVPFWVFWVVSVVVSFEVSETAWMRHLITGPANVLLGVFFFWFVFRFYFPVIGRILKMNGLFLEGANPVTLECVWRLFVERAKLLRNDFVWYFSKVRS